MRFSDASSAVLGTGFNLFGDGMMPCPIGQSRLPYLPYTCVPSAQATAAAANWNPNINGACPPGQIPNAAPALNCDKNGNCNPPHPDCVPGGPSVPAGNGVTIFSGGWLGWVLLALPLGIYLWSRRR
jgi:hypothetical protein